MASIVKQIDWLYAQVKCLKEQKVLYISETLTAPLNSSDTGVQGEVRIVGTTRYECIATNTWISMEVVTPF